MDEKQIRTALEALVQQEITTDMDLWPTIKSQVELSKSPQSRRWLGFGKLILVALIFLMSAVAYALYQSSNGDPGLQSVQDEQLTTPLHLTQTIEGVTVNLDWGYADGNRILLAYTVDEPKGINTSPLGSLPSALYDDTGNYFPDNSVIGFGGLKVEAEANTIISGFDPTCLGTNPPDKLNLTFNLALSVTHVTESFGGGGGGGGGGDGGSSGCIQMADLTPPAPGIDQQIIQFQFQFTLPMIQVVNITDHPRVTANGVEMHIESLTVTPSMTRVRVCYSLPDPGNDWSPTGNELIGEDQVPILANSVDMGDTENCADLMIPAPYVPGKTTEMTLNISDLMTSYNFSPENAETFTSLMAEQGVTIRVTDTGESFHAEIVSEPKDMSADQLNALYASAMDKAFRSYHFGPWVFTFKLP